MRIQKAIQEGHLKFDNKMKLDVTLSLKIWLAFLSTW
jgi:hypothetical protein